MFKPLYGLHRDRDSQVLGAGSFTHSYQLNDWLKNLDLRAGDKVEFQKVAERPEFDEVPIEQPPTLVKAIPGDDEPF